MMKERTVNGIPWEECLKRLRAYKKPSKSKDYGKKSYPYHKVDEFLQLFDAVLGTEHYTVEFPAMQYERCASQQDMMVAKCRISVYDDDGDLITFKEGWGAQEFKYSDANSGRDVNFDGQPHSACTDALKNACKFFGAFGYYTEERSEDMASAQPSSGNPAGQAPQKAASSNSPVDLYTAGSFFEQGEKDGRKIWKIAASSQAGAKPDAEIIFYPDQYGKEAEKFNRLYNKAATERVFLRISASKCAPRNGLTQYIFKGYVA